MRRRNTRNEPARSKSKVEDGAGEAQARKSPRSAAGLRADCASATWARMPPASAPGTSSPAHLDGRTDHDAERGNDGRDGNRGHVRARRDSGNARVGSTDFAPSSCCGRESVLGCFRPGSLDRHSARIRSHRHPDHRPEGQLASFRGRRPAASCSAANGRSARSRISVLRFGCSRLRSGSRGPGRSGEVGEGRAADLARRARRSPESPGPGSRR